MKEKLIPNPDLMRTMTLGFYPQPHRLRSAVVKDTDLTTGQTTAVEVSAHGKLRDDRRLFAAIITLSLVELAQKLGYDPDDPPVWRPSEDAIFAANLRVTQPELAETLDASPASDLDRFVSGGNHLESFGTSSPSVALPFLTNSMSLAYEHVDRGAELDRELRLKRGKTAQELASQLGVKAKEPICNLVRHFWRGEAPKDISADRMRLNAGFIPDNWQAEKMPCVESLEAATAVVWTLSRLVSSRDRNQTRVGFWITEESGHESPMLYLDLQTRNDVVRADLELGAMLSAGHMAQMNRALEVLEAHA